MFKALYADSITLHLINEDNLAEVYNMFKGFADSDEMLREITESYLPEFENGQRTKYGFYCVLDNELAGLSLLGISAWKERKGHTGADTLLHMRGKGVAPRSKPHLFYLGFEILGLNRLETGLHRKNQSRKHRAFNSKG